MPQVRPGHSGTANCFLHLRQRPSSCREASCGVAFRGPRLTSKKSKLKVGVVPGSTYSFLSFLGHFLRSSAPGFLGQFDAVAVVVRNITKLWNLYLLAEAVSTRFFDLCMVLPLLLPNLHIVPACSGCPILFISAYGITTCAPLCAHCIRLHWPLSCGKRAGHVATYVSHATPSPSDILGVSKKRNGKRYFEEEKLLQFD